LNKLLEIIDIDFEEVGILYNYSFWLQKRTQKLLYLFSGYVTICLTEIINAFFHSLCVSLQERVDKLSYLSFS